VTFSKTLGGGKASISGYIVRPYVFEKTYGSLANALVHSTTYSGMGEECYTAIEALNILVDEGFLEKARSLGEYLLSGMTELKAKHSGIIRDARGLGLLCIFELHPVSGVIGKNLLKKIPDVDRLLLGLIPAAIVSELFKKHDILKNTGGREDNLFVNPALIVTKEEIDRFIDSLDKVLSGNLYALIVKLASNMMKITL
ncbi:MAG: aminotransferase class III-fold pyridoxal phosphate-dependent enzyme, partial [Deltaproteobacteria bacterium]|nr:aminotransferase class III-fold pyridoxal phosphate-dependent enzyme [Deltaproteobacteria bacterium]